MTWTVDHHTSTTVGQAKRFYGDGTYTLLLRPDGIPVYQQRDRKAVFLGLYGAIDLPADFPAISFPPGVDQIIVVPEAP